MAPSDEDFQVAHFRGVWSVSGRGASATGKTRNEALDRWLNLVALDEPSASAREVTSNPLEALVAAEDFWERYLH